MMSEEPERRYSKRHQGCMTSGTSTAVRSGRSASTSSGTGTGPTTVRSASASSGNDCPGTSSKQTRSGSRTRRGAEPAPPAVTPAACVPPPSLAQRNQSTGHQHTTSIVLNSQPDGNRTCNHTLPCDCEELGQNKFLFVIPSDKIVDAVSTQMRKAYERAFQQNVLMTWVPEDFIVELEHFKPGPLFVFESFSGQGFKHLEAKLLKQPDFMIIGPDVLNFMFERNVPEYFKVTGYPIYNLAMMNVIISTTGIRDDESNRKKDMISLVYKMGGTYEPSYTEGHITHLVAASTSTPKARDAGKMKLPMMTPEWVFAVWEKSQEEIVHATDPIFVSYELKMFSNLSFTFSQISSKQKQKLQGLVEQYGGTYSPDLVRKTTKFLIIPRGEGDKYKHAKSWQIPCIRPDWILDCCEVGYVVDMANYIVRSADHPLSSTLIGGTQANINDPPAMMPMDASSISVIGIATPEISRVVNSSVVSGNENESVVVRTGAVPPGLQQVAKDMEQILRRIEDDTVVETEDAKQDEEEEDRSEEITKIPARAVSSSNRRLTQQEPSEQKNKSGKESTGKASSGSGSSGGVYKNSSEDVHGGGFEVRLDDEDEGDDKDENNGYDDPSTPEPVVSVFNGRRFFVAFDEELADRETVIEMIEATGGVLVSKFTDKFDFIITTPVYSNPAFLDHQLYTEHWLLDCDEVNSTQIQPAFYHFPLMEVKECKGLLDGVVIAISSYSNSERAYISFLATFMGAVNQDVFSKKKKARRAGETILATTHLICNTMRNEKAEAAIRWVIPVVSCEWILKCYNQKRRLDVAQFTPLDNQEDEDEEEEEDDAETVTGRNKSKETSPEKAPHNAFGRPNSRNTIGNLESRGGLPSGDNNVSVGDMINNNNGDVGTPVTPAFPTPVCPHPRVAAIGGKKLSLGLDSPTATQDPRATDSPLYEYVYPTMEQMAADAEAARAMIPPRPILDLPSPETPRLRREWLEHMRQTWLNGNGAATWNDSVDSPEEMDTEDLELLRPEIQELEKAATAKKGLILPKKGSTSNAKLSESGQGHSSKRSKRTD